MYLEPATLDSRGRSEGGRTSEANKSISEEKTTEHCTILTQTEERVRQTSAKRADCHWTAHAGEWPDSTL